MLLRPGNACSITWKDCMPHLSLQLRASVSSILRGNPLDCPVGLIVQIIVFLPQSSSSACTSHPSLKLRVCQVNTALFSICSPPLRAVILSYQLSWHERIWPYNFPFCLGFYLGLPVFARSLWLSFSLPLFSSLFVVQTDIIFQCQALLLLSLFKSPNGFLLSIVPSSNSCSWLTIRP